MICVDFPGKRQLIDAVDHALEQGSMAAITDGIRNAGNTGTTVSVHICSAPMTTCATFAPMAEELYQRNQRQLTLDQTH